MNVSKNFNSAKKGDSPVIQTKLFIELTLAALREDLVVPVFTVGSTVTLLRILDTSVVITPEHTGWTRIYKNDNQSVSNGNGFKVCGKSL